MTRSNLISKIQIFTMAVIANLAVVLVNAQAKTPDLDVNVDVNKGSDMGMGADWMSNPLIWVVGALVLIIIIAVVARGGGNKA
ncbi:MAG: hypothetical protein ACOH1X_10075 [Kaistella sp.]